MLQRLVIVLLACNVALSTYDIYRSNCRRYAGFTVHARNKKLTTGFIAGTYVEYLAQCVKACLQTANCKAINYKISVSHLESNCEILSSSSDSAETLQAVVGWSFYKPLAQNVIPACMTSDHSAPCNPGYRCEESCSPSGPRFNCVDINECLSNPCKNGGTCSNKVNMYTCSCVPGYTGVNCETDINECASGPCVRGSCTDQLNNYYCSCPGGWIGKRCDIDINECASSPCVRGSCSNQVNKYYCSCPGGWTGTRCDVDINECASSPCVRGSCSNQENKYYCSCPGGWTGTRCDVDINECSSSPCVAGTCHNHENRYSCSCAPLFSGTRCDKFLGFGKKK